MKDFWITNSRFKFIAILLFIMWLGLIGFYYLKADEITKDPCSICSQRMGKEVLCTTGTVYPSTKTYYPNGTYKLDIPIPIDSVIVNYNGSR